MVGYCPRCARSLCQACLEAALTTGTCSACLAGAAPRRRPVGLYIGLGLGCLSLVIILGIVGSIAIWGLATSEERPSGVGAARVADVEESQLAQDALSKVRGEVAALAFAQRRQPEWAAQVIGQSEDWQAVRVAIGPTAADWRTWMDLEWNAKAQAYELADEGPLAQEDEEEEVPDIYRPGEEVALEAALTATPDWVGKVAEHSADWKSVTVWIGPPASEWLTEVELRWNDSLDCYEVAAAAAIPYP